MSKKIKGENYLDRKPKKKDGLSWSKDENGAVTIEVLNNKIADRILQKLIKKPKISYIHLDETGSFIWLCTDGEKNVAEIGEMVENRFGDKAHPLYERLISYLNTLENCGFIQWK